MSEEDQVESELTVRHRRFAEPKTFDERLEALRAMIQEQTESEGHDTSEFLAIICDSCGAFISGPPDLIRKETERAWGWRTETDRGELCPACA